MLIEFMSISSCFWVEMIMAKPDPVQIIIGTIIPKIPKEAVVQAVAMLGAGKNRRTYMARILRCY